MSDFDNEAETKEIETLASIAENIVYRLPGCSDLMIRKTIQEVYRDFCRRSCCLRGRRQFKFDSTTGGTVRFNPVYGGVVDCVTGIIVNGRKLRETEYENRGPMVTLNRHYIPSDEELSDIEATVVEIPKINSESVPSWFMQKYGEYICAGVISRLTAMTGRMWSDPTQAAAEKLVYENGVGDARYSYYANNDGNDLGYGVNTNDLI